MSDLPRCAVDRVIGQCCFNSISDLFNGQTANFTLKPPKVIESKIYVKKPIWSATETTLFLLEIGWVLLCRKVQVFKQLTVVQNLQ